MASYECVPNFIGVYFLFPYIFIVSVVNFLNGLDNQFLEFFWQSQFFNSFLNVIDTLDMEHLRHCGTSLRASVSVGTLRWCLYSREP